MEKVLLAINGVAPNKKAFDYAVQLCDRMQAELKILLVLHPEAEADRLNDLRNKASQAKHFWEDSMMAATFAEAGELETANELMDQAVANIKKLLPEPAKDGIPYQFMVEEGEPERKIAAFVKENRGVVITVYDAPDGGAKKKRPGRALQKLLPIPVVMVQAAG
jgi:nucleotide-binding universal stress UspA family protein